jgi:hypothetical protein
VLHAHLTGRLTVGLYSIDPTGHTKWSVIDSDQGLNPILDVKTRLRQAGIRSYTELSRAGAHEWIFWREPIRPDHAKQILSPVAGGLELFPAGDIPDEDGYGLLIRAPLGVHQASGRRYPFVNDDLRPVSRGVGRGQIQWLKDNVQRADPGKLALPEPRLPEQRTVYPDVQPSPIQAFCDTHPIREVVGQYVKLNHSGVGQCPWPENHKNGDRHPSFAVYPRTNRWYCFTEGVGGDAFNFLCRYHNLSPKEMLKKLQE